MKNSEKKHPLIDTWNAYTGIGKNDIENLENPQLERIINEICTIGKFYYYVLNLTNSTVTNHHENILSLHGLSHYPSHLKQIIDLVHPDDIPYVVKAEQTVFEKLSEIGKDIKLNFKASYCFRMKTAKGNYELFHHQSIPTLEDENNCLVQAINIHTNIHHITHENSYTVLITGICPRKDFHQIKIDPNLLVPQTTENELTKRETEILSLIAKGYSGKEISNILILSEHTTRTHRRNILNKTMCRNSKELVKKAFELGVI